ncbi:hypothetical protein DM02DRAFT_665004 [Periconia macrospinosa]|uniref:Uncharacterized protein n=1 Tax=Periconia macrospinosa TaxID=97972 RepID=A0A2V1CZ78_9PLEO|nr:hypothetical protein DM02DRAFT_665004 [Periconia macrospinosa]
MLKARITSLHRHSTDFFVAEPEQRIQWALLHWATYVGFVSLYSDWYEQAMQEVMVDGEGEKHDEVTGSNRYAALLAVSLVVLKVLGVWLAQGLIEADGAASDATLGSVIFPLVSALLDHAVDIRLSLSGHVSLAWMGLVQSVFRNCFFVRPAAAIMHRDVFLATGRVETVCTMVTAIWLCIPGVPHYVKGTWLLCFTPLICDYGLTQILVSKLL